jgi:hypothetical protein
VTTTFPQTSRVAVMTAGKRWPGRGRLPDRSRGSFSTRRIASLWIAYAPTVCPPRQPTGWHTRWFADRADDGSAGHLDRRSESAPTPPRSSSSSARGLSARAWRTSELARAAVFKVDDPASQQDKQRRIGALARTAGRLVSVASTSRANAWSHPADGRL